MNQTLPNQTLHILAKDARRFWPEIAISVALIAGFLYVQPLATQGPAHRFGTNVLYSVLLPVLYGLIYISWWVLLSRVIQEENLVGDRQFWITRPYRWPSLLAAKLLFLAVFLLLPVALMQAVLLSESGFHPVHLLPEILFGVAVLGITVMLPLAALSTVTTSFAKLTVTMLGIVIAVVVFASLVLPRSRNFGFTPHSDWPYRVLTFAACAAIVILQYARRRTVIARILLGATIAVLLLVPLFFSTALMGLYFPSSAAPTPDGFAIKLDSTKSLWVSEMTNDNNGEMQTVHIPVDLSGVASDTLVAVQALKVMVTTDSGLAYTGPWRGTGDSPHQPGSNEWLLVALPKPFLDKAKTSPVTISLSLGLTQLSSQGTSSLLLNSGKTEVPGIGICAGSVNGLNPANGYTFSCTSALRPADYTYTTARWSDTPCNRPQPPMDQLVPGNASIGTFDSDPAGMDLSPFVDQPVNYSNGFVSLPNNASRPRYLCAGTPLTFTRYALTRRFRVGLTVANLNLASLPQTPFENPSVQLANPAVDADE